MVKNTKLRLYKILLFGRLHGIGFRYAVSQYASSHKFVGTVRNIPEGVEVVINDKNFLKNFDSPLISRVDSQNIEEYDVVGIDNKTFKDFKIIGSEF